MRVPRTKRLGRASERTPALHRLPGVVDGVADLANEEDLALAAGAFLRAEDARGQHLRVVDDDERARRHVLGELGDRAML